MPTTSAEFRAARHVLRMVAELHVRGYQRLRIGPGMSPSGAHWRCASTPVSNILRSHGARLAHWDSPAAHYSSADGRRYFDWADAAHATPPRLAELFIARCPEIAAAGYGEDWLYVGWYQHMLHVTYPDAFPIAYADWECEPASGGLATIGGRRRGGR